MKTFFAALLILLFVMLAACTAQKLAPDSPQGTPDSPQDESDAPVSTPDSPQDESDLPQDESDLPPGWTYERTHIVVDDALIESDEVWEINEPVYWSANIYDGEEQYNESLAQFSLPQRYLFAIEWYIAEVNNGGHWQFYYNSTGIVWKDALEGLRVIDAKIAYEILRESVEAMGGSPSLDRETRWAQIDDADENLLYDLDDRFFTNEMEDELHTQLMRYIRANADSFYFNGYVDVPTPPTYKESITIVTS